LNGSRFLPSPVSRPRLALASRYAGRIWDFFTVRKQFTFFNVQDFPRGPEEGGDWEKGPAGSNYASLLGQIDDHHMYKLIRATLNKG
jgi:hypothetical protein